MDKQTQVRNRVARWLLKAAKRVTVNREVIDISDGWRFQADFDYQEYADRANRRAEQRREEVLRHGGTLPKPGQPTVVEVPPNA